MAKRSWLEFKDCKMHPQIVNNLASLSNSWQPLLSGTHKVNSDVAKFKDGSVGLGFMCKNEKGKMM
ncbi:conserved hypothetical protein [Ricinus communis]|uniref:Uncharacterized protein n=1 Tax=Ricinus communis TaxID=3988 RepID=B9SR91_RICCO|nr:conserved hypothetical protein [Ricinus communis]